jgi:tRNA threonylcarbamoyladenosine biosynthesis protein TsaE
VTIAINSLNDLPAVAEKVRDFAADQKIFLFYGDLGAGKTTFIKSLCAALGVKESVTSPTFSIVNEYVAGANKIFHFDFYRLKNQNEALDMGYEEYFYSGAYCFIEWPEKIPDLIPSHYLKVEISALPDQSRQLTVEKI